MKGRFFTVALVLLLSFSSGSVVLRHSNGTPFSGGTLSSRILKVPEEFSTIGQAVKAARDGDCVIVSPGKYSENKIEVDKSITVSSAWKLTGDASKIEATQIDAGDESLF